MPEGFHPPVEEYLEAILEVGEEGAEVIQARLVERLGHSAPSVSETVRRLIDEGFVERSGRTLVLTPRGKRRAEGVVRKHRLAELLLTEIIGLPWHKAHLEAGRWEHVISDEVEERLIVLLGNPLTCPHGNPIPGAGSTRGDLTMLEDAQTGQRLRLERISEVVELDNSALVYLDQHGFRPGAAAVVRDRAPDGTLVLEVDGRTVAIGPSLGCQLFVSAL
ncbi:MAG TPA: metal-dependent transcriptional regulator [Acidimicrobiales bacterium]|jgi:DtxR family Mn-dependent transcriptional regulator